MATKTKTMNSTEALAEARERQAKRYRQLLRCDKLTLDQSDELIDLARKLRRDAGGLTIDEAISSDRGAVAAERERVAEVEAAPATLATREDQAGAVLDAAEKLAKARAALVEAIENFEAADIAAVNVERAPTSLRQLRSDDVLFDAKPIDNVDATPSESVEQARRIKAADYPQLNSPRLAIPQPPVDPNDADEQSRADQQAAGVDRDRAWMNQSSRPMLD